MNLLYCGLANLSNKVCKVGIKARKKHLTLYLRHGGVRLRLGGHDRSGFSSLRQGASGLPTMMENNVKSSGALGALGAFLNVWLWIGCYAIFPSLHVH